MFLVNIRRRRARLQLHKTATGLQPICKRSATRYDRHTTAIRLFGGLFADPYVCNLSATRYDRHTDRHTSVWRSVCSSIRLQPICNQIRPPYDRHTSVWRPVCSSIRLQPICNQGAPIHYIYYIRYRRYRTSQKTGNGPRGSFFCPYIIDVIGLR